MERVAEKGNQKYRRREVWSEAEIHQARGQRTGSERQRGGVLRIQTPPLYSQSVELNPSGIKLYLIGT